MITKSLREISLSITEEEYRTDGRLHYSTLAKYERNGFNGLDSLFEQVSSPSLVFGSIVDEMITGTAQSFINKFLVAEYPSIPDSIIQILKKLFVQYGENCKTLDEVCDEAILSTASELNYQNNWKPETKLKAIREKGEKYYELLQLSTTKTIITSQDYQDACNAVQALRISESTKWYFEQDNPFDNIERLYQLKFNAEFEEINYSCMADLIIVDHKNKTILPCDLKTTSHNEWDFYKSFVDWNYQIQARLYWRIIQDNISKDDYFKDFKLLDYHFIVVNKKSLTPLVWVFSEASLQGDLMLGRNGQITLRDPFKIGKELHNYLEYEHNVPIGIEIEEANNLTEYINKI